MSSPGIGTFSITKLFNVGPPSKRGQVEAAVVAALYFLPCLSLLAQLPACKGRERAVLTTALFAAARGLGYVFRNLALHKLTQANFEAYLILSSAATFLFIGSLGDLLAYWFQHSSGKGHLGFTVAHGSAQYHVRYATVLRVLSVAGVVFAIIGIHAALHLFSATTSAALASAQHGRAISNRGFVALMAIYTAFAFTCTVWGWFIGPTASARRPSRMLVILALTAACCCLMVRVVFGLLSIQHPQYSSEPKLLYTVMVLPEMLALYIVAIPGLVPRIGWDCDHHMGIAPMGTSSFAAPGSVHNDENTNDSFKSSPAAMNIVASSQHQSGRNHGQKRRDGDAEEEHGYSPNERGSSLGQQRRFSGVHRGQSEMDESMLGSTPDAWSAAVRM